MWTELILLLILPNFRFSIYWFFPECPRLRTVHLPMVAGSFENISIICIISADTGTERSNLLFGGSIEKTYLIAHSCDYGGVPIRCKPCDRFEGKSACWTDERDDIVPEMHIGRQTGCCGPAARRVTSNMNENHLLLRDWSHQDSWRGTLLLSSRVHYEIIYLVKK